MMSNSLFSIRNSIRYSLFAVFALFIIHYSFFQAFAMTGPTGSAGAGGGTLTIDGSGNIGFGLATGITVNGDATNANFGRLFTIASTTDPALALKNMGTGGNMWVMYSRGGTVGRLAIWEIPGPSFTPNSGNLRFFIEGNGANAGHVGIGLQPSDPATSTLQVSGTIAGSTLSGGLSASDVSSGVFGTSQGSGSYAFPASLGVATSSKTGLPQSLSVYGGGYFSGNLGVGTTTPTMNLQASSNSAAAGARNGTSNFDATNFSYLWSGFSGASNDAALVWDSVGNMRFGTETTIGNSFSEKMRITTTGNVGVATTTPGYALTVAGTVYSSTGGFRFPDGSTQTTAAAGGNLWTASSTAIYNSNTGNVGIGTTNPSYNLDIYSVNNSYLRISGGSTGYTDAGLILQANTDVDYRGLGMFLYQNNSQKEWYIGSPYADSDSFIISRQTGLASHNSTTAQNSNALFKITSTGNIGMGTTTPAATARLTVVPVSGVSADMNSGRIANLGSPTFAADAATKNYVDSVVGGGSGSTVGYWTLSGSNLYASSTSYNVGIGVTNPVNGKLEVATAGTSNAIYGLGNLRIYGNTLNSGDSLAIIRGYNATPDVNSNLLTVGSSGASGWEKFVVKGSGNVGIGTTTPSYPLDIAPTGGVSADMNTGRIVNLGTPLVAADAATKSYVDSSVTTGITGTPNYVPKFATANTLGNSLLYDNGTRVSIGTTTPVVKFQMDGFGKFGIGPDGGAVMPVLSREGTQGGLSIDKYTSAGVFSSNLMTLLGGGNVGIGTTTPGSPLHVMGQTRIDWGTNGRLTLVASNDSNLWNIDNSSGQLRVFREDYVASGVGPNGLVKMSIANDGTTYIAGNVGIGTSTPSSRLDVSASGANGILLSPDSSDTTNSGRLFFENGSNTYAIMNNVGILTLRYGATAGSASGNVGIALNSSGYVGIATTTLAFPLEVAPTSAISADMNTGRIQNLGSPIAATDAANRSYVDSVSTGASGVWLLSGSNLYASSTSWKVGVGTVSPVSRLHSYDFSSDGTAPGRTTVIDVLTLETANTAAQPYNGFGQGIAFRGRTYSNGTVRTLGRIATVLTDDSVTNTGSAMIFQTVPDSTSTSTPTEKMRISYDGTIGFGTSVPTSTARITVNPIGAVSADMATGRIQRLGTPLVATDAATKSYVDSSVTGGSGTAVGYWTLVGSNLYNSSGSNVGVGTSTPSKKLQVFGTFGSDSGNLYTDGTGVITGAALYDINNAAYFIDPSAATSMKTAGDVLIGGSGAPGARLDVVGNVNIGSLSSGAYSLTQNAGDWAATNGFTRSWTGANGGTLFQEIASTTVLSFQSNWTDMQSHIQFIRGATRITAFPSGNVGIGTVSPGTSKLYVNGAVTFAGSLDMLTNNIAMNGGNIGNVGKLTVTAIDPLYSIDGGKYATYAASIAGGVKEEFVGRGTFPAVPISNCEDKLKIENCKLKISESREYVIDFNKVERGSDLWVWYNAVDFSDENVEVLVTPVKTAIPIAYEIVGNTIVFHASADSNSSLGIPDSISFSYRLIAKRHDWKNWPTFAKDQKETPSFVIKSKKM